MRRCDQRLQELNLLATRGFTGSSLSRTRGSGPGAAGSSRFSARTRGRSGGSPRPSLLPASRTAASAAAELRFAWRVVPIAPARPRPFRLAAAALRRTAWTTAASLWSAAVQVRPKRFLTRSRILGQAHHLRSRPGSPAGSGACCPRSTCRRAGPRTARPRSPAVGSRSPRFEVVQGPGLLGDPALRTISQLERSLDPLRQVARRPQAPSETTSKREFLIASAQS